MHLDQHSFAASGREFIGFVEHNPRQRKNGILALQGKMIKQKRENAIGKIQRRGIKKRTKFVDPSRKWMWVLLLLGLSRVKVHCSYSTSLVSFCRTD